MNGGAEQGECRLRLCKTALKHKALARHGFHGSRGRPRVNARAPC